MPPTPPSDYLLPTPREIVEHLDRFVRGQHRAKQDVAVSVYNHYLSQAYRDHHGQDLGRFHLLLLGPTGSGKTFLIKKLAEFLGVPVSFASATSLVEAGYRGRSVDDIVKSLLDRAKGNPRVAERGILFIDEIDKIRHQDTGSRDVSGEGVQNALLTMLDGRIADSVDSVKHEAIDTSRILFVCTGAFVGLEEIVNRRLQQKQPSTLGFQFRPNENLALIPDQPIYQALCQATTADLVSFGMIPEFIGRFATITALHELGREDLRAIVSESTQGSALERQQQLARIHGIDLEITSDALDAIADEAMRLGTGARGLHRLIGRAVDSVDHRWPDLADAGIARVVIDRQCIETGGEPTLIHGPPVGERIDALLRRESMSTLPKPPSPYLPDGADRSNARASPFTDTRGWSDKEIWDAIEAIKTKDLDWNKTTGSARNWWDAFEQENRIRSPLVLRLAEELQMRHATITDFFLAYVYSNTENIQANLYYMDYVRLKREEEGRKKPPKDPPKEPDTGHGW